MAFPTNWLFKTAIPVSGTGSDETNYIVKLNIHRGENTGDTVVDNVFLGGRCKTDFSDIRFTDASGTELAYYIHSYGNYEIIHDNSKLGSFNIIMPNGDIFAASLTGTGGLGQGIWKSSNNGESWTNVYNTTEAKVMFRDSNNSIYACSSQTTSTGTYQLLKSISPYTTWTSVLDMSAVNGIGLHTSMCEDSAGNLYFGRYQDAVAATIYKSTDNGATWNIVYGPSAVYQHVHGMYVDTNVAPEAIYAGLDATTSVIAKSVNDGVDWAILAGTPYDGAFNQMYAGAGFRVFGGEASVNGGPSIFRTTDDATFTAIVQTSQNITGLLPLGTALYAFGATNGINKWAQVYRSTDDGVTWKTIWMDNYYSSLATSAGLRFATPAGTPTGAEEQILVGALDTHFNNSRIFDGGSHYQALVFVKLVSLPAAGDTIYCYSGKADATTTSAKTIYTNLGISPVAHYRFNEGSGVTINDSSGNTNNATLTIGAGSWAGANGRRSGFAYPDVTQDSGNAITLSGNGFIDTASTTLTGTKNLTYIVWLKSTMNIATDAIYIVKNKLGAGFRCPIGFGLVSNLYFTYGNGAANTAKYSQFGSQVLKNIYDGSWHMMACTLNNDDPPKVIFYVDSMPDGTGQALDYEPTNGISDVYRIGATIDGSRYFVGTIDDVQIYNTALTGTQIRQIYEDRIFSATEPELTQGITESIGGGSGLSPGLGLSGGNRPPWWNRRR